MTGSLPPFWITGSDGRTKLANPGGLFSPGFTDNPHEPRRFNASSSSSICGRSFQNDCRCHMCDDNSVRCNITDEQGHGNSLDSRTRVVLWESHVKRVEKMEQSLQVMMEQMQTLIIAQKKQQEKFESFLKAQKQSAQQEPSTESSILEKKEASTSIEASNKRKIDAIIEEEAN